jgi:Rrf2 family protein
LLVLLDGNTAQANVHGLKQQVREKMLKISTKGRYGVRAMLELGLRWGSGPVLMSTIAAEQGLSEKYLHSLLTALRQAGLVKSVRGAHGGFALTRPPDDIRVDEIVVALEGPLDIVHCVRQGSNCMRSPTCVVQQLWEELSSGLLDVLSKVPLGDLVEQSRKLESLRPPREARASRTG